MEFGILGPLAAWDGERELQVSSPRQRALLCALLLRANEVVATSWLVEELWEGSPSATATNAVQVYVSRLRRVLGESAIETQPTGYRLRVAPGALDRERFDRLVAQGRGMLATGAAAEAGEVLHAALGLWRGAPLAEFAYDAFARGEIARLEGLRLEALELLLEADLACGRHREAIGELERLVGAEPLRESLRGLLMLALYRSGRQADALAAYQDARTALVDGLGLDPSEQLSRLETAILRHDPSLDAPEPALAVAATPGPERRKVVTVLFCAAPAARSADPEELRRSAGRTFGLVAGVVERHGGTAAQVAGGAAMAVFGVPAVREDDALRALRAAVEIQEALREAGVQARVGVASSEVIASAAGTVDGEAVTAARGLSEAAAAGEVLLSGLTLALAGAAAEVEPAAAPPGTWPVAAHRLLAVHQAPERLHGMRFVGRQRELATIAEAWERARAEQCCVPVTVVGDAGIGKSRLVAEALVAVDAHVATGRCLPYGEGITFWPVIEVLRQLDVAPPADAAAPIRALLGESQAATSAGEIAWAFRKTLEHAAADGPLVVVFDDIHWGEEAFLDLVEQLSLLWSGAAILLLCVARPELLERRPAWPGTLRLDPLTDPDVDELVPVRLAGALREGIARAAGGNPLFVQEMLAVAGEADGEVTVPPTLQAVLAARLDQLDPAERTVLERAAVEGEVFHHGAVQALATAETQLAARLAALVRKGLIRPGRPDLPGEDAYRFRHILIRDAAYATLPKTRRIDLHASHAHWLETQKPGWAEDHADILAYHYATALDLARATGQDDRASDLEAPALRFLLVAGERSLGLDTAAALTGFERALALTPPGHPDRPRALSGLGYALFDAGRQSDAIEALQEAVVSFRAAGDLPAAVRSAGSLSEAYVHNRDPRRKELMAGLLALLEPLGPSPELVSVLTELADIDAIEGRGETGLVLADRALALAEELGLGRPVRTLGMRALNRLMIGDPGALDDFRDALALAAETSQSRPVTVLLNNYAIARNSFEGPAAALETYREGIAHAQARGMTAQVTWMTVNAVGVLAELGEIDEALEQCAAIAPRARTNGNIWLLCRVLAFEAELLVLRGQADRIAAGTLELLESQAGQSGSALHRSTLLNAAAAARIALGRRDIAASHLTRLMELDVGVGRPPSFAMRATRSALEIGEPGLAERIADLAGRWAPRLPFETCVQTTARAALAEARGDHEAAAGGYAEAAERWAGRGTVPEQAFALLGQGRCLLALGRAGEAAGPLQQARAIFERLQATPVLAETDALLRQSAASSR